MIIIFKVDFNSIKVSPKVVAPPNMINTQIGSLVVLFDTTFEWQTFSNI